MAMFHGLVQNVSLPQNRFMHLCFRTGHSKTLKMFCANLGVMVFSTIVTPTIQSTIVPFPMSPS